MSMIDEVWRPKVINGVLYMVSRGHGSFPYNDPPAFLRKSRLMSLTLTPLSTGGPPPPPPGIDRSSLPALYGTYKPVAVPADYTQNHVGARNRLADLTEWNSPNTLNFNWASIPGTGPITIQDKIVYGRFQNAPRPIFAENCIFRGPRGFANGESAIIDFHNPTTRIRSEFLDCTFAPQDPQPTLNAFKGSFHKVERCHAIWCNDGDGCYSWQTSYNTNVEWVGSKVEAHVFYPATHYADHSPRYWDGTSFQDNTAQPPALKRALADGGPGFYPNDKYYDTYHKDGTHTDGIEIHGAQGSHTYNAATNRWTGDGVHIWGCNFDTRDGYDVDIDPSGLGIPLPTRGDPGSYQWGTRGWGDNPKRGLPGGGQKPGLARPISLSTVGSRRMNDGRYAADGSCVLFLQLVNRFPSPTSAIMHDCWCNGGALGVQEQRKGFSTIQFTLYDVKFGPSWFPFGSTTVYASMNQHAVRIYDGTSVNDTSICTISGRPSGHPSGPAAWYNTMTWDDPADLLGGHDGQILPREDLALANQPKNGIRFH